MAPDEPTSEQSVLEPFVQAYSNYRKALEDAIADRELQRRLADTHRHSAQAWREAIFPKELQRQVTELYRTYARAALDATSLEDLQRRAAETFREIQQAWQSHATPNQVSERLKQVYSDYARGVQEALAPADVQKRVDAANGEYASALKDAWAKTGGPLGLRTLGAITQTMMAAGCLQAAAAAAARQRWMASANVTNATAGAGPSLK
jgi:hypothetical protein